MREEPNHGMNWSPASKKNFTSNIDRKKDFTKVAKAMSKSTGDIQAYYYSSFKNTVSLSLTFFFRSLPKTNDISCYNVIFLPAA